MLYEGKRLQKGKVPRKRGMPKKSGRRLLSGLLALVLCLTLVPVIYADTVVSVKSWHDAGDFEEKTLYWVDNNDEESRRPAAEDYQPLLYFRIEGEDWRALEEDICSDVGLSSVPQMTVVDNGNNTYTVSVPDHRLPAEIIREDEFGAESEPLAVEWALGPAGSGGEEETDYFGSYIPVDVNEDNVEDYPSAKDQLGWYYVLTDEFSFDVQLRQGDRTAADGITDALYQTFLFSVDTGYDATTATYLLDTIREVLDVNSDVGADSGDPSGTITISGLWKYNLDGSRIEYSVEEAPNGDGRLDADDGIPGNVLDAGDWFQISYDNSGAPNVGSEVDKVYDGGILYLTLTGTKDYSATKVWEDQADSSHRPDGELQLWRYRAGQSYTTAAPVRDDSGSVMTIPLDKQDTQEIAFGDLPKYDAEGYEYIYVVREYLTGDDAGRYTQVLGAVDANGDVSDTIWVLGSNGRLEKLTDSEADAERAENDTYLYNEGTLSNKLSGTVTVDATKIWKAAAFQSELTDVQVELTLQSRPEGSTDDDAWEKTDITKTLGGGGENGSFSAENLGGISVSESVPKYDNQGRELEYRWVETAVYEGESENLLEGDSFTLTSGGSRGEARYQVTYQQNDNGTVITNAVSNWIDYTVEKVWLEGVEERPVTFALYRTIGEQSLTEDCKVLTFEMDEEGAFVESSIEHGDAYNDEIDKEITISGKNWEALLNSLPEYDEEGRRYEYLILEVGGSPTYETTIDSETGDYTTIVTNGLGAGERILVQKNWVDDSDTAHREPVEVTVYDRNSGDPIQNGGENLTVTLGETQDGEDPVWYEWVALPEDIKAADVYIRETGIGTVGKVELSQDADGSFRDKVTGENHTYEATYDRENVANEIVWTVTNRRLGNVDLTVVKDWRDGNGEGVDALQTAMAGTGLTLAVKLEISASDGTYIIWKDYVNLGGEDVPIKDNEDQPVSSVQPILTADEEYHEIYFHNLPKYDTNGTVVRYTVEEVWLDQTGNEITLSAANYPEVYALWSTYTRSVEETSYDANDGALENDTQEITLTNTRTGVTDAVWYKEWHDVYMYEAGSRPDIYLDIYQTVHTSETETETVTQLIYPSYRWTDEGLLPPETEEPDAGGDAGGSEGEVSETPAEASGDTAQQYVWQALLEDLPKYDAYGFEIVYSAVERTNVNASEFDYAIAEYWWEGTRLGTRNEADTESEDAYTAHTTALTGRQTEDYAKYALNAGGTFVNRLDKPLTIEGRKLWTNLPAGYPAEDLPTVTFALYQRERGGAYDFDAEPIATLTISDWSGLNNYTFQILYEGENIIDSSDGEVRPETQDQQPLPKYTPEGRLYEYTLRETGITGTDGASLVDDGSTDTDIPLFEMRQPSNTFQAENVYNSPTGSLSVKKILELPTDEEDAPIAYPAVRFHLYRTYTKNSGEMSEQELVQTITWSSQEVQEAYQEQGQATVEKTLTFEGLAQYAPNGSEYVYQIEEDQDFLGGYETKCGPGDLDADSADLQSGAAVEDLLPDENKNADATFWNRREDPQTEFVTLTGTKVWQDFDNAFGLRPERPYVYVEETDEWVPVIRLSVTRRAAAQEGQEAPGITETLEEGTDYTVTWTQEDDVTWTYQIWGIGDPGIEDPQYPAEPGEPETPTDPQTDPAPKDPDVSEPPSTGENDQSETPTAAEGNDQTAGSEEETTQPPESSLSAASLHSDPADEGGSGSEADTTPGDGSDITPDPTEEPETDPGEEPPAPAQTELEKWAPNGARWVYSVKEELNSDLPDALKEQYEIYFNGQTAGEASVGDDTITMSNLTNSLETSARFEKKWVGSDGQSITADYMGLGEMSVTFTLYVKAGEDGIWQPAEEYFENMDSGLYSQIFGEDYQFTQTLGNRHIYDSWTGTFQHLPRVVKVNDKIVELSYRVAETKLTYHNGRETVDVPITVTVEGDTFTYTVNDSLFTGVTGDYATSTSELTNQLATTSLKVQKVWANDRNNAYDTRPDTDEEGMTWETSFLIQRTTAATPAEADWQAVQVTGDNGQTQDLVVTLTGTDTDGTLQAPASMTIPGLPQKAPDGERYFYRAVELQPGYKTAGEEASLHDYIVENEGQYNTAYTATYAYDDGSTGGDPDNGSTEEGFITTVTNTMSTTKVYASKSWEPAEETGVPVTLKLQYMTAPAADGAEVTWQEMASVKVTVDGTKDAFSPSKPYYEYEAWKAVWEDLPLRMPGSYLGENGTTQYRVVEETSGSYVQVSSDIGEVEGKNGVTYPEFQFTNKAITSLTVLKQWHTTADKIADSITVQLWRTTDKNLVGQTEGDVEKVAGKTAILSAANNWKVVFGELDRVDTHGDRYYYYAVETSTGESLEVSYDHGDLDGTAFTTTIINKGFTDITVTKTWQDDNDAQDLRPDTLKLTLYRKTAVTEQEKVDEVTLSAEHAQSGNSNVWTYTFQDLPDTDENGNLYTYRVEEEPVSGYTESRTDDLDLVNTLGDEDTEVQIQGEKTWVGDDPAKRPASITVILLQNGTEVKRQEVRPNEDGKWTYDFGNWPVYDDSGRAYTYTVQEEPVDGYGTQVNGYDIVNGQGGLTVTKQVYSGDKTREFRFTVTLSDKTVNGTYGDMTFIDGVAEFTLKDGESKTAARLLPGIRYTVTEERVSGYGIRIEGSNPGTIPFGDTAEVLVINYDDTTPPPDPKPDPDPDPDPDPTPDPDPDPDPTPDPDETPDPDIPDTPDEPGTPNEPDTPEEPDDSVHTGDDAQLALYLTLLAASLAGAAAVIFLGRRSRKKE